MKLQYTPHARRQLLSISRYLRERSPRAASEVRNRIRRAARLLTKFPHLGHAGALPGTRELVVPGVPYVLVHRVEIDAPNTVSILAVYHSAQLRPGQAAPDDD